MPEEQVAALPPEVRTMIMAMVASAGGNAGGMMPSGMNMNGPMMGGMMPMGPMMGPMMHEMGPGEMGMVGQGMGMGMGDGMGGQPMPGPGMVGQGMVGPPMNTGPLSGGVAMSSGVQVQGRATPDVSMGMMGDGFQGGPQGQQGMGMPMGGEYGMQVRK
jgi:pre-mRNA 3'-end-processing factor FIP1